VNGKIIDAVTNILNAKLFARLHFEREYLDGFLETEVQAGRRTFWYMERVRWFQLLPLPYSSWHGVLCVDFVGQRYNRCWDLP